MVHGKVGNNERVTSPPSLAVEGVLSVPVGEVVAHTSLRAEVANRLILAVAMGSYLPGERFPPERDLAATLGVGRVTVRAAIAELVQLGLLRSQQGRGGGTFIVRPDSREAAAAVERALTQAWERLVDQLEAESWMHGMIAAAAAERHDATDALRLHACLAEFRHAEPGAARQQADKRLHLCIGEAAHSQTLHEALLDLERRVHLVAPAYPWGDELGRRARERRALHDHEQLVAAILARDCATAQRVGRDHARINLDILHETLRNARHR